MEVNKAKNMIEHEREIFSRPARTWFEPKTGSKGKRPFALGRPLYCTYYWMSSCLKYYSTCRRQGVWSRTQEKEDEDTQL